MLFEPYEYIIQNPGKDIRTLLINAFNLWLKVPEDKVRPCILFIPSIFPFITVTSTPDQLPRDCPSQWA